MTQQMSELNSGKIKITNDGNIIMQFSNYHHVIDSDTELYYKHQADKVIAELEKQVHDYTQGLYVMQARAENEACHQKYKRCLAMARWCLREEFFAEDCHCERWVDWAIKWYKRWLELAEKFKEAK